MKRKIFLSIYMLIGVIILFLMGMFLFHRYQKLNQEPVSIMIASDIHYLSPDYRGEYFKEPNGIFDGKLTHYSPEYFDAFLFEVLEKQPEVLILSGDLTLNGSKKSHEEVVEKLKEVQNAGIEVLVIPGNHDIHSTAGDYSPEEPVVVENASSDDFMQLYESFGPAQALSRDEETFSYIYEVTPYLRLLMIDTNLLGKGTVQDNTLAWVETELKKAQLEGVDVIAVTHQNLHIHNELLYFSYQIYNADELLALYEKYDVKLNLSGHIHVQSIVSDENDPGTTIPEVAVGSLAVCGTQYGMFTYDGKSIDYTTQYTDVSAYAKAHGFTDNNLLNFNNYSIWYFEEVARLQATSKFSESGLSEADIALLADTYASINSSYFMGELIDPSYLSSGLALWRAQSDNFIYRYFQTMLKEIPANNRTLIIDLN